MFYPVIIRTLPSPSLGRYLFVLLAFLLSNTALAEDKGVFVIGQVSVIETGRLPHPPAKVKGTPANLSARSSRVATLDVNVRGSLPTTVPKTRASFAELHSRLEALEAAARKRQFYGTEAKQKYPENVSALWSRLTAML